MTATRIQRRSHHWRRVQNRAIAKLRRHEKLYEKELKRTIPPGQKIPWPITGPIPRWRAKAHRAEVNYDRLSERTFLGRLYNRLNARRRGQQQWPSEEVTNGHV